MQLQVGDVAPDFALSSGDGKTVSSESLRGTRYFLYFYPKDDTRGCTAEACELNDNLAQFEGLGVPVFGVSRDDAASHQTFRQKHALQFDLLTDANRKAHEAYGAWGSLPDGSEGVIRSSFLIGPDGRIQKAWYFVKPIGHAFEVLDAVRQA